MMFTHNTIKVRVTYGTVNHAEQPNPVSVDSHHQMTSSQPNTNGMFSGFAERTELG